MPIFIAKHYDGTPVDVVLTATEQLAQAYWQGKGIIAHTVTVRSDADLTEHPTGVLPIISTREVEAKPFGLSSRTMHVVRKSHS